MSAAAAIGIDARKIRDYGIGRYLQGLLAGLAGLDGDERYVLFLPVTGSGIRTDGLPGGLAPDRFRLVACDAPLYSVRELFAFRGVARRHGLDLLHFPHYVRALAPGCPIAVTIHDAIHLSHPPGLRARLYARGMMRWATRTADTLFTVSNAVRDDLSARLRIPRARFRVTPNGVAEAFRPPGGEAVAGFRAARELTAPFVLCVASHRPHKNLPGAVEGFRRAGLGDAALVVPARDEEAEARLRPVLGASGGVRILSRVEDDDLPLLYASARIVLIPSLAEGFGLPALEAAACGAAVLASDLPSHAEVLGEAAERFDPRDPAALATALARLWNDEPRRRSLTAAGPERARAFSWDRTARLTLEGYRAALR